jgi:hypothetical protein
VQKTRLNSPDSTLRYLSSSKSMGIFDPKIDVKLIKRFDFGKSKVKKYKPKKIDTAKVLIPVKQHK